MRLSSSSKITQSNCGQEPDVSDSKVTGDSYGTRAAENRQVKDPYQEEICL